MSIDGIGRPYGVRDSEPRPPRAKPQNIVRDWLLVRRRRDGLKLREIATEFRVSTQFVQQTVTTTEGLMLAWRTQYGLCRECGHGIVAA